MKKELKSKLKAIAIEILGNETDIDIESLKQQAIAIYGQLCILQYADNEALKKINSEPAAKPTMIPIVNLEEAPLEKTEVQETLLETSTYPPSNPTPNKVEEKVPVAKMKEEQSPNLLYELEDLTAGFENLPEFEPAKQTVNTNQKPKSSLNESLNRTIKIGLNDRIAFVKHLFNGNQEDYTRVISQLNTINTSNEANEFINQIVKPEYNNWDGKEDVEERFVTAVFCKFEG